MKNGESSARPLTEQASGLAQKACRNHELPGTVLMSPLSIRGRYTSLLAIALFLTAVHRHHAWSLSVSPQSKSTRARPGRPLPRPLSISREGSAA